MTAELTMLQSQGADVREITSDSRQVRDGALFLASAGIHRGKYPTWPWMVCACRPGLSLMNFMDIPLGSYG